MDEKVLVLYTKTASLNPTPPSLYAALEAMTSKDVIALDVGRVSLDRIRNSLTEADAITIDAQLLNARYFQPPHGESVVFERWRGLRFYEELVEFVFKASAPKVLISSGLDLHWTGPENDYLFQALDSLAGMTWTGSTQTPDLSEIPDSWVDDWMLKFPRVNEVKQTIAATGTILIEFPGAISEREFRTPRHPVWDISIGGVPYNTRRLARSSAERRNLSVAPYRSTARAFDFLGRRMPRRLNTYRSAREMNRLRYRNLRFSVTRSKIAWTDGSAYRYAIRKFFEIPAWGTPLICLPHSKMADFGFLENCHYISAEPEQVGGIVAHWLASSELREQLASMGRRAQSVVWQSHTSTARASQLLWSIRHLLRDSDCTFGWREGRFTKIDQASGEKHSAAWSRSDEGIT